VAPWSSKAQAAPAFIDGRAELYGEKFVIDYSTRSRRC
jgi:hypothetical protein